MEQLFHVIALVKPFRARAVLDALARLDFTACTVREVRGYNRQKNRLHRYLGSEYSATFVPKVEISVFVPETVLQDAIRTIIDRARTGSMGDGKIIVCACQNSYVVR